MENVHFLNIFNVVKLLYFFDVKFIGIFIWILLIVLGFRGEDLATVLSPSFHIIVL